MVTHKHNIIIPAILIVALSVLSCGKPDTDIVEKCCQCLEDQNISNAYDFPIKPGDEEWKKFTSHQAMVDACHIPDDSLKNMCTYDLVETWFGYPLLFVITAFNNVKEGLDQTRQEFNGFEELIKHDDAAIKIADRYENMDPGKRDSTWTSLERGKYSIMFWYTEFTLGYDPVLNKLNNNEKKELLKISLNKYESKKENNYSGPSLITTIYLISNILYDLNYSPFIEFLEQKPELLAFVNGYLNGLTKVSDGDRIVNFAKGYLEY